MIRSPRHFALSMSLAGVGFGTVVHAQDSFYPLPLFPSAIESGDINNDGVADLVIGSVEGMSILINQGDGVFDAPINTAFADGVRSLTLVDVDGDHDRDIVAAMHDLVVTMTNDGTGAFTIYDSFETPRMRGVRQIEATDIDGDGDPDIVLTTSNTPWWEATIHVYTNDGTGTFAHVAEERFDAESTWSLVTGDLDDDGDIDIATTSWTNKYNYYYTPGSDVRVLLNDDGDGTTWVRTTYPTRRTPHLDPPSNLILADFDHDGDQDLLVRAAHDFNPSLDPLRNDGTGTFNWLPQVDDTAGEHLASADIDADGDVDMIMTVNSPSEQLRWVEHVGTGFVEHEWTLDVPWYTALDTTLVDVNGDGLADAIMTVRGPEHGVIVSFNDAVHPGPALSQSPLIRGESATFTLNGALDGETVYFLYTLDNPGYSVGLAQLGGIVIDLTGDVAILGSSTADAAGTATLTRTVPAPAPLLEVTTQAVIRRGVAGTDSVKSNYITSRVED